MRELVSEVVDAMQPQARQRGIALGARITEAATPVSVDGTRIERAIANVVRNALEHTPAGGNVSVDVRAEPTAMLVSVTDTGEGIAPQDLEQIWQRFYRASKSRTRRDDEGAGLGLAIVRGIIESHGGSVEAESQVGTGTTVHLRLPIHIPQSPPPRERGTERAAAR